MDNESEEIHRLKKRLKRETHEARRQGQVEVVESLLDLIDDCDRAIEMSHDDRRISRGLRGARDQMIARFENIGFYPIQALGEEFDPEFHEAISIDESAPEGIVSAVHRRGWKDSENYLVRAAMVTVGKAK